MKAATSSASPEPRRRLPSPLAVDPESEERRLRWKAEAAAAGCRCVGAFLPGQRPQDVGRRRRALPAAALLEAVRREVGDVLDLTDRGTREAVYAILQRGCPTNDPTGTVTGERIPAPPAAILAKQLRELRTEAAR